MRPRHQATRGSRQPPLATVAAVLGLLLAGCGEPPAADGDSPPAESAPPTDAPQPDEGETPDETQAPSSGSDDGGGHGTGSTDLHGTTNAAGSASSLFPPDPLPSATDLDGAVSAAHEAYLGYRAAYDEAARTGFADEDLVEAVVATTDGDLRDAMIDAVGAFALDGLVIDGESEVIGARAMWLHVPVVESDALRVTFEVCLALRGALLDRDGAIVEDLSPSSFVIVEMAEDDGTWVVWSQREQLDQCPAALGG